MNTHDDLERRLHGWMVDTAPAREPAGLVVRAMAGTARVHQRPGFVVDSGLGRRWLALPRLSPAARVALVALLALAALVAAALAGAVPLPREPLLARNGLIAYELDDIADPAYYHIRVMNPDATRDREFATGGAPVFSRDGRYLAYATALRFRPDLELVVAAADGSSRHSVPRFLLTGFALSPDGSQVAMRREDDAGNVVRQVTLVNVADGSQRKPIDFPKDPQLDYTNLAWSPDGRSIACVVIRRDDRAAEYAVGIDVVDVATGEVRRVSSRLGEGVWGVSWSPDGRALAFTAWPDGTPTPQGDQFGGYTAPAGDVFAVGIDGTGERNLSNLAAFDERPAWSPDGSSIAWLTTGDEGTRLAVVPVRDMATASAPVFGAPAERFVWAPDGSSLLLTHSRPVKPGSQFHLGTIQRVDVRLTPRAELRPPVTLVERSDAIGSLSWQPLLP
jgi:dipeptidyl aminopeptidase/acylaminoacyl peptidase